jgi:hypothetical protein
MCLAGVTETPELDSLVLFGTALIGGRGWTLLRARRRRPRS